MRGATKPKIFLLWLAAFSAILASTDIGATEADWVLFKQRFLQPEGRIVDTGRDGISHSEGQGVAMLLAVHHDDRTAFDTIWQWTRQNLQVRDDKLLAWRWSPKDGVTDKNNASDGDLFMAWALLRAHRKWQNPDYLSAATETIWAIRRQLLRKTSRGTVLLPGTDGFDKPEGMTINLSYWLFPAIRDIAQSDPAPEWQELQQTGTRLLLEGRSGRWGLPADWITLGQKMIPASGFPPRFGYDAVRIPLYLLWDKRETAELLQPFKDYWGYFKGAGFLPAWASLTDDSIDSYNASPGIRGIVQLTLSYPELYAVRLPALDGAQDYYSAVLLLLAKVMLVERTR
ncbi:MAG TPA: glycosyl hydrolase family 8 [Gallionella sp.]|nr:glycosyl hydrolase family 8 [Gallionella sp.]